MITRDNKYIRLFWAKADLFQAICTETAYNARTLADDKGNPLFDQYTMMDDERPFFDEHIAQAMNSLLQHFRRIVPDSLTIDVESDICGLTFSSRMSPAGSELYGQAELEAVDQSATDVLRCMIISEWYLSVHVNDMWTAYLQKLAVAVNTLSTYLFRFYRPALRQSFRVSIDPEDCPPKNYDISIDAGTI